MGSIFDSEIAVKLQQHYSLKDVAEMLSVSEKPVYRWVSDGTLRAHRIAGSVRVPKTALLKIIREI